MATIVLQVADESLIAKLKQACKMLQGVVGVSVNRAQKAKPKKLDVTKTDSFQEAMDDVKHGRVTQYESADDLFAKLGIAR